MKFKFTLLIAILGLSFVFSQQKHTFQYDDKNFLLDGKPFQIISGEIHYIRVPKEAWRDRMKMAKAMGLNTIGTYIFWNVHEPQKGKYDFKGNNDIAEFVKIAQEEGLWVILRPSPYVCAEWEFGGYPYWLLNEKGLVVRSKEKKYTKAYTNYLKAVGKQLAPLQINHGGNILMVQVENEYGSFGNDKEYLELNRKLFVKAGFDGILYTCDPRNDIGKGHLPGLLPAINGVDKPEDVRKLISENHNGKGPFYIAEWYPAWFDWWGTKHHTVPIQEYADRLENVLKSGISINMYMFHGGTTRGFMNGANFKDDTPFEPQISSYDYDAPLDEAGNATEKFWAFRNVIQKYLPKDITLPSVPAKKETIKIDEINFNEYSHLFTSLPQPIISKETLTFEQLNQPYGYVLYRKTIPAHEKSTLKINGLRDYAIIWIDGKKVGTLDRRLNEDTLNMEASSKEQTINILVENMGRINFGPYLLENYKGIIGNIELGNQALQNWEIFSLPFNHPEKTIFSKQNLSLETPIIKKGNFNISKIGDTYLDFSNWGKGVAWINGHNLGKYWSIGPQQTLYVPKEWLKEGNNEIIIFEMQKPNINELKGIENPILDKLQ